METYRLIKYIGSPQKPKDRNTIGNLHFYSLVKALNTIRFMSLKEVDFEGINIEIPWIVLVEITKPDPNKKNLTRFKPINYYQL